MRSILTCGALFLLASCIAPSHQKLIGTWRSNKNLTIGTLNFDKAPPPHLRSRLENIFGKLEITYTRNRISSYAPDLGFKSGEWHHVTKYKILDYDDTSVVVQAKDPLTDEIKVTRIHFEDPDRYWIALGSRGWKEYFERVD